MSVSDQISNLFNNPKCLSTDSLLSDNSSGLAVLAVAIILPFIVLQGVIELAIVCWRVEKLREQGLSGFLWRLGPCCWSNRKKSQQELLAEERKFLADQQEGQGQTYAGTNILSDLLRDQQTAAEQEQQVSPPLLTAEALQQSQKPSTSRKTPQSKNTGKKAAGTFAQAQDRLLASRRAARMEMLQVPDQPPATAVRETMTEANDHQTRDGDRDLNAESAVETAAPEEDRQVPQWNIQAPSEEPRTPGMDENDLIDSCKGDENGC